MDGGLPQGREGRPAPFRRPIHRRPLRRPRPLQLPPPRRLRTRPPRAVRPPAAVRRRVGRPPGAVGVTAHGAVQRGRRQRRPAARLACGVPGLHLRADASHTEVAPAAAPGEPLPPGLHVGPRTASGASRQHQGKQRQWRRRQRRQRRQRQRAESGAYGNPRQAAQRHQQAHEPPRQQLQRSRQWQFRNGPRDSTSTSANGGSTSAGIRPGGPRRLRRAPRAWVQPLAAVAAAAAGGQGGRAAWPQLASRVLGRQLPGAARHGAGGAGLAAAGRAAAAGGAAAVVAAGVLPDLCRGHAAELGLLPGAVRQRGAALPHQPPHPARPRPVGHRLPRPAGHADGPPHPPPAHRVS